MNCIGFVYIWFDRRYKMFYVGSHVGHENDRYICSSKRMLKEYRSRPQDFKRRIIERCDSSNILSKEQYWLNLIKVDELYYNQRKYYNVKRFAAGGDTTKYHPDRTDIIKRRYGKKHSEAVKRARANMSDDKKKLQKDRQLKSLRETLSAKTNWYQSKKVDVFCNSVLYGSYNSIKSLANELKLDRATLSLRVQDGIWIVKQVRRHPFNVGDIITFNVS